MKREKQQMTQVAQTTTSTQLGDMIAARMDEKGLSIRDMAKALDITYEHVRRVVRGEGIPSKYVLKLMCEKLDLDYHEAEKIATSDKITKKYGGIPLELSGKDPAMEPLAKVWQQLDPKQQAVLLDMAKSMAKGNRASK